MNVTRRRVFMENALICFWSMIASVMWDMKETTVTMVNIYRGLILSQEHVCNNIYRYGFHENSLIVYTADIDECASTPCQNSGNCTDSVAEYVCECDHEWVGTHCEGLLSLP